MEHRSGYSKVIFTDEGIVLYKKDKEINIPVDKINYIDYAKPTLLNYILSTPCYFSGTYPGRLEIHLKENVEKTSLYLVKIKKDEVWRLPKYYRVKIGISTHSDPD